MEKTCSDVNKNENFSKTKNLIALQLFIKCGSRLREIHSMTSVWNIRRTYNLDADSS